MNEIERAESLAREGHARMRAGDLPGSLEATEQAVALYRDAGTLTGAQQVAFADAVHWSAVRLAILGRPDDALPRCVEALALRRRLLGGVALAGALNDAAILLSGLGRPEEALDLAQEAVDRYRAEGDAGRPRLATALVNLANRLAAVGRTWDAHQALDASLALVENTTDRARTEAVRARLFGAEGRSGDAAKALRSGLELVLPALLAAAPGSSEVAGLLLRDLETLDGASAAEFGGIRALCARE